MAARALHKQSFIGRRLGFAGLESDRAFSDVDAGMAENIHYPTTYRASIFRRFGRAHLDKSSSKITWILAIAGLTAIIIYFLNESSSYITLFDDRIEKKSWFGTKIWRRDEAAGLWYGLFGGFKLVRKYNKGDYFIIPPGIKRDATWHDWLKDVPEGEIKPSYPRIFSRRS